MMQMRITRPVIILMDEEYENIVPKNCTIDEFMNLRENKKSDSIEIFAGPRYSDNADVIRMDSGKVYVICETEEGVVTVKFVGEKARRLWIVLKKEYTPYKADPKYDSLK